jgi:formate dehydrogenase major subunit
MIGSNALEAHPLAGRRVLQAKEKGAHLIVCDPRFSTTAKQADTYVRYKPSSQIALLNSMMYWIIKEDLHDKEFIANRTKGFEDLKATVEKYADVEARTGVPTEFVKEVARKYATAKNAVIIYCLGITEQTTGTHNVMSLGNLAMLTGNIGRPGVGVNPLRGQNNVQGACDMGAYPNVFSGYQKCELPEMREKMEKAWGTEGLASEYGLTLTEQIDACGDEIKAMVIMGENPVMSFPDSNHVRRQLEKLDFLVLLDIFPTDTMPYADVVLPGACFAEKDGTFTSGERRVQRIRTAVPPPGDAKPDWEILMMLAQKLGLMGFDFTSAEDVFNDMASVTPQYAGITFERLEKPEALIWPCPTLEHPGTPILHKEKFALPDGLGAFYGIEDQFPAELPDAEYPFELMTGRILFHYHTGTMTRRSPTLDAEVPTGYVEISVEDGKELDIKTGDRVKLKSRRGEAETNARVTSDLPKGVLYMSFHFNEGPANNLTNTALDPLSKMPELKYCAVSLEKA